MKYWGLGFWSLVSNRDQVQRPNPQFQRSKSKVVQSTHFEYDKQALNMLLTIRKLKLPPSFQPNSELDFALEIYNASIDAASKYLVMEARLFRDDKSIYGSSETAVDVANQADLARVFCTGVVRLTPDLEPGNYYLQVVVTDKLAKNKQPPVVQWIDFEIVKKLVGDAEIQLNENNP